MAHFGAASTPRSELQGTAALAVVAILLAAAFGVSTLITPLYLIYQQKFGFSQITLTLIYAAYALGNIAALLFLGGISDRVGRRYMALFAIAILIIATTIFIFARSVVALYAARILSGLGIGVASRTGNAWLAELAGTADKTRATIIGTSSNFLGLGFAPLLSGSLAQYAPWPLHLSFIVYAAILCLMIGPIWFTQETVQHMKTDSIEIRPKLSLPREIRAPFVAPAITGFGLMALTGFYAALMPSILSHDLQIRAYSAAGALFFELAMVVAIVIVATRNLASHTSMISSLALMIPVAAAIVATQLSALLWVMLVTTALVGVLAGLGYRGSLQVVNEIAPADKRAAVVSSYFICCFIGNALPVIGVGVLSSASNALIADIAFACMIAVFAVVALFFSFRHRPSSSPRKLR